MGRPRIGKAPMTPTERTRRRRARLRAASETKSAIAETKRRTAHDPERASRCLYRVAKLDAAQFEKLEAYLDQISPVTNHKKLTEDITAIRMRAFDETKFGNPGNEMERRQPRKWISDPCSDA
jgi:hypothetical protein